MDNIMKQLIEDYKRRLKTVGEIIDATSNTGSINDQKKLERLMTKQGMINTIIAELEREYKSKFSAYDELWVVASSSGADVDHVFIDKEDAEKEAKRLLKEYLEYYRDVNKKMSDEEWEEFSKDDRKFRFKVIPLDDAIYNIKENIRDEASSYGDPSY